MSKEWPYGSFPLKAATLRKSSFVRSDGELKIFKGGGKSKIKVPFQDGPRTFVVVEGTITDKFSFSSAVPEEVTDGYKYWCVAHRVVQTGESPLPKEGFAGILVRRSPSTEGGYEEDMASIAVIQGDSGTGQQD
jgi:hypothetical protein